MAEYKSAGQSPALHATFSHRYRAFSQFPKLSLGYRLWQSRLPAGRQTSTNSVEQARRGAVYISIADGARERTQLIAVA